MHFHIWLLRRHTAFLVFSETWSHCGFFWYPLVAVVWHNTNNTRPDVVTRGMLRKETRNSNSTLGKRKAAWAGHVVLRWVKKADVNGPLGGWWMCEKCGLLPHSPNPPRPFDITSSLQLVWPRPVQQHLSSPLDGVGIVFVKMVETWKPGRELLPEIVYSALKRLR